MIDLIVETDLGHHPDDFFTLCYLAAAGARLRAICVVPGDRDQLAVARLLVKELGLDIPVGACRVDGDKFSSGGMHHALLDRFGLPREAGHDGRARTGRAGRSSGGQSDMKMYILIKESVPTGFALVAVAHAPLAAYLKSQDTPEVQKWLAGPFFKAVWIVTGAEFERAKECPGHVVITESALGGAEVVLAFRPRDEWPGAFKFFRLSR